MKKLKLWLLGSVPMVLAALAALLYVTPKHVGVLSNVMPLFHLVPIFIWGVMHSRDISLLGLAVIGVLIDVATSVPLGISALSYAFFLMLIWSQRKYIYREGFIAMWFYFALLLFGMQVATWMMVSFFYNQPAPFSSACWQWLFTVLCYPPLHYLFYPWVEKLAAARYRLLHA